MEGRHERRLELVERRHRLGAGELRRDERARDRAAADALDERQAAQERVAERGRERVARAEAVHDLDRVHRHVGLLVPVVDHARPRRRA